MKDASRALGQCLVWLLLMPLMLSRLICLGQCSQGAQGEQTAQGHEATVDLASLRAEYTLNRVPLFRASCVCLPFPPSLSSVLGQPALLAGAPISLAWGWGNNTGGTIELPDGPHVHMCHADPSARLISKEPGPWFDLALASQHLSPVARGLSF